MPIPDYQTLMLPVLQYASSGVEINVRACIDVIATQFQLDDEEKSRRLPSGAETYIANRVHWAKSYLVKAGLLEGTRHSHFKLTERGQKVLANSPKKIDNAFLRQFSDFVAFVDGGSSNKRQQEKLNITNTQQSPKIEQDTPIEQIETAYAEIDEELRSNLLSQIHKASPAFFENLILDLLTAMGYGGGRQDAAQRLGKTGDGGVDGIIKEDVLGLDTIYLQAKRYQPDSTIGESEIRGFSGSLIGKGSTKGVFVATCHFSSAARQFAENNRQQKIILIDREDLTRLMVRHNVGVEVARTVEIKRINADYFDEYDGV